MANVNIKYVLTEVIDNNLICWSIKDNKALLAEQDSLAFDAAESAKLLENKLAAIGNGIVTVTASGKPKKDRAGAETRKVRSFNINLDREAATAMVGISTHTNGQEIEKMHHLLLDKEREILTLKFALEKANDTIDQLKKELEEEEEEETIAGFSPKMIETVLSSTLVNIFAPKEAAAAKTINGIADDNSAVFNSWIAVDSEALQVVKSILVVIEKDPTTYNFIKSTLLSNYK
jgi:hypothetical protein